MTLLTRDRLAKLAVVIGAALFIHGASGFSGSASYDGHAVQWFGFTTGNRLELVAGAACFVAARLWQQRPSAR